jgi:hypothetical protein
MTRARTRVAVVAAVAAAVTPIAAGAAAAAPDRPGVVGGSTWQQRDSLTTGAATHTFTYGTAHDVQVTGDWDGNGTRTPGIVRKVNGNWVWYLRNGAGGGAADVAPFAYGKPYPIAGADAGDVPVVGDWNGDGKDSPGVVRVRYSTTAPRWLLRDATTSGSATRDFAYGSATDTGFVAGDWDGNGTDTPRLVRSYEHVRTTWLLRDANSGGAAQRTFAYGSAFDGETPVVGDWNGDGTDGIGLIRHENDRNRWLLRETATPGAAQHSFFFGAWTTRPVLWS